MPSPSLIIAEARSAISVEGKGRADLWRLGGVAGVLLSSKARFSKPAQKKKTSPMTKVSLLIASPPVRISFRKSQVYS